MDSICELQVTRIFLQLRLWTGVDLDCRSGCPLSAQVQFHSSCLPVHAQLDACPFHLPSRNLAHVFDCIPARYLDGKHDSFNALLEFVHSPPSLSRTRRLTRQLTSTMQRHDGSEYLPALFPNSPPSAKQTIALMRLMQEGTAWNLVVIIAQVILVAEIVRTFPAEIRMMCRLVQRRKPNVAEALFLSIKYLALLGVIFDILVADVSKLVSKRSLIRLT